MPALVDIRRRSHRKLGLWLAYWVFLFGIMHTPIKGTGPLHFDYADKLAHCGLYLLLTALGAEYRLVRRGRLTARNLALWVVIFAAYGAFDEWLQQFTHRTMSFYDWLADLSGILSATVVVWRWRRKLSEPPRSM